MLFRSLTHHHRDHSPGSRPLAAATGAPIVGPPAVFVGDDGPRADAAFDADYAPDRVLAERDTVTGEGWTLEAIATPGHTSNHLAFALPEAQALFSGDHVMGWSTSVIAPPDGDMAAYLNSLAKLLVRDDATYLPTHGPAIADPKSFVRAFIEHRREREAAILRRLAAGDEWIPAMVAAIYVGLAPALHGAAARSVLAHLIRLVSDGRVVCDGPVTLDARFRLKH